MICRECQHRLSDYIDGDVELGERLQIERHLAACEPCRAVRDDLIQISHFGRHLPAHTPRAVVWNRIKEEIDRSRPGPVSSFARRVLMKSGRYHFRMTLPQLAAGAIALAVLVSAAVMVLRGDSPAPPAPVPAGSSRPTAGRDLLSSPDIEQIESRIDVLRSAVDSRKASWNTELRDAFERNLLYIDQSLIECRHHLSADPADPMSQELMLNAYREKLRLLEGFSRF